MGSLWDDKKPLPDLTVQIQREAIATIRHHAEGILAHGERLPKGMGDPCSHARAVLAALDAEGADDG